MNNKIQLRINVKEVISLILIALALYLFFQ
jgi:hypothetical protein